MTASDIVIKGAREHNLRNIDLTLPRHQLICLTGVSGSGKSSLAFDTLYAEGQRRYVESLSSFARQFLGQMPKPDLDHISGLSPSISISQKSSGSNPRSTVGTITEIYDYLRVLYARVGQAFCPRCGGEVTAQSREQIIARILEFPAGTRFSLVAPLIRGQKGEYRDLFQDLLKQGFARVRVDGQIHSLTNPPQLDRQMRHDIDVVIDRLVIQRDLRPRLAEAVELAMKWGKGTMVAVLEVEPSPSEQDRPTDAPSTRDVIFSSDYACGPCGLSFEPPSPQLFSFNSYQGMCRVCDGLGELYSFDPDRLIPDPSLSMKKGCIELLGPWKELGRWRRHIFQGVANTMERVLELEAGTLLETPWKDLPENLRDIWLRGTGDQHVTYTWRGGNNPSMYGGKFEGILAELLSKHRNSKSRIHRARLEKYMSKMRCPECRGDRLLPQARAIRLTSLHPDFAAGSSLSLPDVCRLSIRQAAAYFSELSLDDTERKIATEVLKEIRGRLGFLLNVGLDYLMLDRTAPTLSGGESQRIRLAGQIGSGLVGVLYILDEPSIGLHPRDNDQLLATLQRLRDMGNTVVVVEHDEETIRAADHVIDFGPGPGVRGGEVVVSGTVQQVMKSRKSVTGNFLSHRRRIEIPATRRPGNGENLRILGAEHNNLRAIDVSLPLGSFICVTGVSGSGKSSLIGDILVEALRRDLNGGQGTPGRHRAIEGLEHLDKMIAIDQSPIGRTPRSNPATYIKVFDDIRQLFTKLPEAKRRGYKPGRFSFNVRGGRCEACEGNGSTRLEMDFLADVWVTCPVCQGKRFSRETLQVHFKEHSITDVLELDIQQALELFENIPDVRRKLQTLHDVGLDYLKIGQPSPTLSGGEAQRIKLARELVKKSTGKTLYLLDEPTTGLHFADIEMLLKVLHGFVEAGNTVLVVEHNLDVIKTADWIIDLGPEGGGEGGRIVATGTPEEVAESAESHTGRALRKLFREEQRRAGRSSHAAPRAKPRRRVGMPLDKIRVRGAAQHNLRQVDAEVARDQMTVLCGPSGSGKSSLAMDTIYAEGQRRYVESLSAYARQFVSQMQKPQLEHIEGLSPAIAIEQKNLGHTPRSTVGTVTEIYDYLRILLARLGQPHCPECLLPVGTQTADEITDKLLGLPDGTRLYLLAPLDADNVQSYETIWQELRAEGYGRVRLDGTTYSLDQIPEVDRRRKHQLEVVIDRLTIREKERGRIAESVAAALSLGDGVLRIAYPREGVVESDWETVTHSQHRACQQCGRSFELLSPHHFSFNSSLGWCHACQGLGTQVGTNPAALIQDKKLSLREGALLIWPDLDHELSQALLTALAAGTGLDVAAPFEELNARQRRILLHGTADRWFEVPRPESKEREKEKEEKQEQEEKQKKKKEEAGDVAGRSPWFRFQFKGVYPTLEQAARLSAKWRTSLEQFVDEADCSVCGGSRLRDDAAAVQFHGHCMDDLCRLPLAKLYERIRDWKLDAREEKVAGELLKEVIGRLQFLLDVGLEYLTLSRTAASLSNGESQRIRLASQLGSGLCGVLYVLDEPTIGLHPRDNRRLLAALHKLRDLGNTLLVVEHDRDVIEGSDQILDFGPGSGRMGGEIVARGTPAQLPKKRRSVTGPYLNGRKVLPIPSNRRLTVSDQALVGTLPILPSSAIVRSENGQAADWIEIVGARHHNLRQTDAAIPLAAMTAITGPSGSGKSSLMNDVLHAFLARHLHRASTVPGACQEIRGHQRIDKVILVDQQPLGNTPTSNPATYSGVFDLIRRLFAELPDSKVRGYTSRRFSFNVPGGRCEACEGNGQKRIEMHFLPDVWVECDTCRGPAI
jgi:excinuclease ABC subunit A